DQTRIDRLLGTHASLAPGEINTQRKDLDARIDLKGESWRFRAGHQGFLNVGTGAGVILALDPNGDFNTRLNNADITYDFIKSSQWDITAQMSYLGTLTEASLNPYPPGIFGRAFPDGLKDDFQFRVDEIRAGITALYGGISNHRIRFGIGTSYTRLSDVEESRNFKILPNGMPLPLPFSNVLTFGEQPLLAEHDRQLWYGFAQDEWWFAPDWILTTGARLDHYSDFGTTINPRVALVWNASSSLTAKALYGRAFRAPSFTELYGNSTIAVLGNLNLKPEIINMIEFSLTKQWDPQLRTNASLFGYSLDDQIRGGIESSNPLVKMQKRNTLGRHGYGMELESEYAATKDLRFQASYAYFSFDDAATNDRGRFMPKHQLSAGFDWHITDYWMLNTRLDWVSKRELMYENKKAVVDSYPWASVSLRYSDPKDWFFSVTLDNALDIDAAEPSVFPSVPYGIPLPGRSLMGQFGWRFR
ncbi:MAG: TonB-dependent receptor, partial [Nitrosomonas ureae]